MRDFLKMATAQDSGSTLWVISAQTPRELGRSVGDAPSSERHREEGAPWHWPRRWQRTCATREAIQALGSSAKCLYCFSRSFDWWEWVLPEEGYGFYRRNIAPTVRDGTGTKVFEIPPMGGHWSKWICGWCGSHSSSGRSDGLGTRRCGPAYSFRNGPCSSCQCLAQHG